MQDVLSSTNPSFRATKKRRTAYRQRLFFSENDENQDSDDKATNLAQGLQNIVGLNNLYLAPTTSTQPLNTADLVRKRLRHRRTGGVEFKTEVQSTKREEEISEKAEDPEEGSSEGLQGIKNKLRIFTRQTGVIGDADRHMMAYVDSELAKRSSQNLQASTYMQTATQQQQPSSPKHFNISQTPTSLDQKFSDTSKVKATVTLRQPVTLGMLQEIDLGDEARERNVKMTEQATRRLDGEMIEDEQEIGKYRKKGGKMKSGKDGNSWWERKKRRGDDIKRDQLVDQVLRENRLEIYEEPHVHFLVTQTDQAADDRIAEAFRREFMDNASSRQRKKNTASQASARGQSGKKDEVLKGPKLGGSRSARAAVRETLLKSAKK